MNKIQSQLSRIHLSVFLYVLKHLLSKEENKLNLFSWHYISVWSIGLTVWCLLYDI